MKRFLLFGLGNCLIFLAFSTDALGLPTRAAWGIGRYLLLTGGVLLVLGAVIVQIDRGGRLPAKLHRPVETATRWLERLWGSVHLTVLLVLLVWAGLSAYALWFTSQGTFQFSVPSTNFYRDLGNSFLHGHTYLSEPPDLRLAQLSDPYDSNQRGAIPTPYDVSYYKNRYYLYWGPTPGLVSALYQSITRQQPSDAFFILVPYIGLALVIALLLWQFWQSFYPCAPGISLGLFLAASSLNLPMAFVLGRTQTYETAILYGQFFLFLGLWAWWQAERAQSKGLRAAAGVSWGLAIASRYNLLLAVGVFLAFSLFTSIRANGWGRWTWLKLLPLITPLGISALLLGGYNLARFGDMLNTGMAYQFNTTVTEHIYFSPAFIGSNLYMYFLYPLQLLQRFPFIKFDLIDRTLIPAWVYGPKGIMFDDVFTGMIYTVPILGLLILRLPAFVTRTFSVQKTISKPVLPAEKPVTKLNASHLALLLTTAGMLQFAFLLVYYYGAMRFILDFLPLLLLATAIAAWDVDHRIQKERLLRPLLWIGIAILLSSMAVIGFFAAFDIPPQLFRQYNPENWHRLGSFWNLVASILRGIFQ